MMRKIMFFILITFLLVGCQPSWITQKVETIEVGTIFSALDITETVEGVSVKVKEGHSKLNKLGESELTLSATKDGKEKEFTFVYNVIDTTKPTIIVKKLVTIPIGQNFVVANYIDVQDNSGEFLVDKVIVSEFSSAEPGSFTAKLTVQDSQGNVTEMSLPYSVVVPVEKITLSKIKETVYTGKTLTLSYKIAPDNSSDKSVTWSTSNSNVATVDNKGVVKGIAEGVAIITVQSNDGYTKSTSEITVKKAPVASIDMKKRLMSFDEYYWNEGFNWAGYHTYRSNSADSVSGLIAFINMTGRKINYITFTYHLYNSVGDKAYDDIRGQSTIKVRWIGPVEVEGRFDATGSGNIIGYCETCAKVIIKEVRIEYADGGVENGVLNVAWHRE